MAAQAVLGVVAHIMPIHQHAAREGLIVERGSHAALLEADGVYAGMWAAQQAEQEEAVQGRVLGEVAQ